MKRLIYKLKKILSYLPIILKDDDGEDLSFYLILQAKLKSTLAYFTDSSLTILPPSSCFFIVKYIKIELALLELIIKNSYFTLEEEEIIDNHFKGGDVYVKITPEIFRIYDKSELREKKVKRLFWKILEKRSSYWWD
jgi:hypothetical protein